MDNEIVQSETSQIDAIHTKGVFMYNFPSDQSVIEHSLDAVKLFYALFY